VAYCKIEVEGNVGNDPELRYTADGTAVCSFSLACNKSKPDGKGGWIDEGTTWFRVTTWREAAERTAEWVRKGCHLFVIGRFTSRTWESQEGEKRTSLDVNADVILNLSKKTANESSEPVRSEPSSASSESADQGFDLDDLPF